MNPIPILRRSVSGISALTVAILVLTGCTDHSGNTDSAASSTTQLPIPFTGLTQDMRIRWTAEPGIDLLTVPVVVIRAYRESYVLGGLMASPKFFYPGFENAVPSNGHSGRDLDIRPYIKGDAHLEDSGFQTTTPIAGTWREHILSLTGDPTSGYTAKVCSWNYATAVRLPNGQYRYPHRFPPEPPDTADQLTGIGMFRITLKAPSQSKFDPTTAPQRGSAPNPTTDVFGGWKILNADNLSTEAWLGEPNDWPLKEFGEDQKACMTKAPDPFEKRAFYVTGEHPKSDFPTQPADPGWPAAGT
ncbi:hypothetical protein CCUG60884_02325 [Mycobacteroides salmoniphilum]|uniref:Uncharacterized protein n=1 Tax=Mycobacteroides salmoniphilum TaxID=404941 RepID=A0A4R8SSR2_9MYCO|nr:hypothetical protein CCUG60884_02325 [Mycobacteroides salmoniphilum]